MKYYSCASLLKCILPTMTVQSQIIFLMTMGLIRLTSVDALMISSRFLPTSRQTRLPLANNNPDDRPNESSPTRHTRTRGLTIPVLGPIPNAKPLLLGGEMTFEPPTPFQWTALEECVTLHQEYLEDTDEHLGITGIDAAPLVAIIDGYSGSDQIVRPLTSDKRLNGRYATIAAIVGIASLGNTLDTADEASFMESIMRAGQTGVIPLNSRIRLVGVGRANLRDFFYKVPTETEDQEHDTLVGDDDDDCQDVAYNNIVMAEFDVLTDNAKFISLTLDKIGAKGARSPNMSPAHALAAMSKISTCVSWLHDNRRRLVAGLVAAKVRLQFAEERIALEEDLIDHDGLGLLGNSSGMAVEDEAKASQSTIDDFLSRHANSSHMHLPVGNGLHTMEQVAAMDNYGLNYYSAFSSLLELKNVAVDLLEPYYSKTIRETEEHELMVLSFVAFRALKGFCSPEESAWALQCTNSVERLQKAVDIMLEHKMLLENLAEDSSKDLLDCGEECTDLW